MYKILNNILEMDDYSLQRLSKSSKLPSKYQQIEYIESTGTQYIDTGFKANTTTTKFVGAFTPTQKATGGLLGSRNNSTTTNLEACNVFALAEGTFRLDWLNGNSLFNIGYTVGTKYEIEITRGTLIINGTKYKASNSSGSYDQLSNFLIGNFNNVTTPYASGFVGYIHECKLYSNDVLIRDFIPVKRISDNVVGMYDVVTKTFFTNAGTGKFTYGSTSLALSTPFGDKGIEDRTNDLSFTDFNNWESEQYDINENKDIEETEQIKAPNIISDMYTSITADTEVQPNQVDFIPKAIEEIKANQPNAEQIVDNDEE